ncbi:MAG: RIP metalloprotease RseP [Bacteroidetes bacterium]|nr:MAG: RIP metalloprotease RseP [Bacteroidota bacterium]
MDGLIMTGQLILALSIIVGLHEFGHFIAARAFGIRVEKFYLFFDAWGIKLFSFKKGDTEYGIGWLPLGGYVKIAGMIDESMDKEAMKQPAKPDEFRSKPAWQRLIVMLGGVIVNFFLGVIILAFITMHYDKEYLPVDEVDNGIYAYELAQEVGFQTGDKIIAVDGKEIDRFSDVLSQSNLMGAEVTVLRNGAEVNVIIPDTFYKNYTSGHKPLFITADNFSFTVDSVLAESPAESGGIKKGDKIYAVDSQEVKTFGDFRQSVHGRADEEITISILRDGDSVDLTLKVDSFGMVGIMPVNPYKLKEYTIGEGFKYGWNDGVSILAANVKGFGKIFSGKENAAESLQGPIGMATFFGAEWKWHRFWYLTAMISLILAFMNLLPIPALDGGHVMFLTFEIIMRKPLSDKFQERAQMVGMAILLSLMVFVILNDIWKNFIR